MLATSFYVVLALHRQRCATGLGLLPQLSDSTPSVGVLNLGDVAFMISRNKHIPFTHLLLWGSAAIFAMAMLSILLFVAEPLLRARWANWVVAPTHWSRCVEQPLLWSH